MRVKPFLVMIGLWLAGAALPGSALACEPPAADAETVTLAGVTEAGDPRLADGRILRLAGLAPRQDPAEAGRFRLAVLELSDERLRLVPLGDPDRWGRIPARLVGGEAAGTGENEIAARLIRRGAAWHVPEAASRDCDALLRRAELQARGSAETEPPLDGHDPAALKARTGRLVLVEGRVASVGERSQRTYLNFSRNRGEGATIVVPRALWREMRANGWTAQTLRGKRVRVRGVMSGADGLSIDLAARAALETIE